MRNLECSERKIEFDYKSGTGIFIRQGRGKATLKIKYRGAYGMGEKYDAVNQKGKKVINEVNEKFCFQGDKTYCPVPFFWTDSGVGVYVDTCYTSTFDFREEEIIIETPLDCKMVLFTGKPKEIVSSYMKIFGEATLPPEWAFGVWISANRWDNEELALTQIERLKAYDFPATVMVLEAWSDEATFYKWNPGKWNHPKEMIDRIHDAGLKLVLWQIPVYKKMGQEEADNEQNRLDEEEALKHHLCLYEENGEPYRIPEGNWFAGSLLPDFTNPRTYQSWFAKRQDLMDMGVDGFKTDGGEHIHSEHVKFHDGSNGREGKNKFARDYTSAYKKFVGKDKVVFSRAGFSGQHTISIQWAGDQQSRPEEMKSVLKAGLSAAASGILFWGFDIAGFAGPLPSMDLYRRATQFACFCPIMQWHSEPDGGQFKDLMAGSSGENERSPWNIAKAYNCPEFIDEMRYWHKLREELRPYIYATAKKCVKENTPMMRPLFYQFPEDENGLNCEDEYMFGEDYLVAPFIEEDQTRREVYLPEGKWKDFFTGEVFKGGQVILSSEGGKIPVFIRI